MVAVRPLAAPAFTEELRFTVGLLSTCSILKLSVLGELAILDLELVKDKFLLKVTLVGAELLEVFKFLAFLSVVELVLVNSELDLRDESVLLLSDGDDLVLAGVGSRLLIDNGLVGFEGGSV